MKTGSPKNKDLEEFYRVYKFIKKYKQNLTNLKINFQTDLIN